MEIGDKYYNWFYGEMTIVNLENGYIFLSTDKNEIKKYTSQAIGRSIHLTKEDAMVSNVVVNQEQAEKGEGIKTMAFSEFHPIYRDILLEFKNNPDLIEDAKTEVNKTNLRLMKLRKEHPELWTSDFDSFMKKECASCYDEYNEKFNDLEKRSSEYLDISEYKKLADEYDIYRRIYKNLSGRNQQLIDEQLYAELLSSLRLISRNIAEPILSKIQGKYNQEYSRCKELFQNKIKYQDDYDRAVHRYEALKKFKVLLKEGYIDFSR